MEEEQFSVISWAKNKNITQAMKIKDVARYLENLAPKNYQESYDNAGLLVGDADSEVCGILVSLDCTEAVVEEAVRRNCNLIVSHHPIIFGGLKRLTGANYVERTVLSAIRNDIALYAIHTNLDNIQAGVNNRIADRLKLTNREILVPKSGHLRKLVVFCPMDHAELVRQAVFSAGAGAIGNYSECAFNLVGEGTFKGGDYTKPFVGRKGERHTEKETRIEVVFRSHQQSQVVKAMRQAHPYEEVAYDIYQLENADQRVGAGMVGLLPKPMDVEDFLAMLKKSMNTQLIRHTRLFNEPLRKVAVCGGSGSFLLPAAKQSGADVFITGDFKYHEFFDAEDQIIIADIGHYESEQFTIDLLVEYLQENFPTFAVHFTEVNTNPINYF